MSVRGLQFWFCPGPQKSQGRPWLCELRLGSHHRETRGTEHTDRPVGRRLAAAAAGGYTEAQPPQGSRTGRSSATTSCAGGARAPSPWSCRSSIATAGETRVLENGGRCGGAARAGAPLQLRGTVGVVLSRSRRGRARVRSPLQRACRSSTATA